MARMHHKIAGMAASLLLTAALDQSARSAALIDVNVEQLELGGGQRLQVRPQRLAHHLRGRQDAAPQG